MQIAFGWEDDSEGVWRVTKRARANADFMAARRGDVRRHHIPDPLLFVDQVEPSRGRIEPFDGSEGALGIIPRRFPVVVVCPHCGSPQTLDARSLGMKIQTVGVGSSRVGPDGDVRIDTPEHWQAAIPESERVRD